MTMAGNDLRDLPALTWKELYQADYVFHSRFQLELAEKQFFYAEQIVRIVPKKRIVTFGTWGDKAVVAKLFLDPNRAKEHMEKEAAGLKILRENKIPTPALYYQGYCKEQKVYVLLFERIFESASLEEIWQQRQDIDSVLNVLKAMMVELATQHVLGIIQHDLHLKNFLITRKRIYTLDADQIEVLPYLLPKKMSMDILALFLSQLGVGMTEYQAILFNHYAKVRGWMIKQDDVDEMFLLIKKRSDERWHQYEQKIFRECTEFSSIKDWQTFGMFDRRYLSEEFIEFLRDPDHVFAQPHVQVLKNGRSSTVIRVKLGDHDLVIKRYNIKDFKHWLRRCLRPTRASLSWRLANKLKLFGVNTATPVAFIEKRKLGLRNKSYFVMEYISDAHAGQFISKNQKHEEKILNLGKEITSLLKNLAKLEVTHGDLKITNILLDKNEKPILIDLDGMQEHGSSSSLRNAWQKEITRFLENFEDQPAVLEKFKGMF